MNMFRLIRKLPATVPTAGSPWYSGCFQLEKSACTVRLVLVRFVKVIVGCSE